MVSKPRGTMVNIKIKRRSYNWVVLELIKSEANRNSFLLEELKDRRF